ncbi:small T antigen [Tree shrew polyomavirus 1]|uniref:Small T antigen n=1 Tax=Tree shrew polyomavirus 1 TaxID=2562517 RepID=A0A6P1E0M6_9POLY|nr:small T antigen [Tree shrew polyomavirus 1]QBR53202.1 small T antigen [Tree shrew polyomavirus 1]
MDQALSTAERHELMDLLKLTRAAYGNISLMKRQYKKVSKEYHPDKGGDPQKMQRLNELFQKLQVTLLEVRSECGLSSSACAWYFWDEDFRSLGAILGEDFSSRFVGLYPECSVKAREHCFCITCALFRQHKYTKIFKRKKCLVWGECFCYSCYIVWFGFPRDWSSFHWWMFSLKNMDVSLLNIWTELGL